MESAPKLIVDAALRHGVQGRNHHVERFLILSARVVAQQEIICDGPWKLRCAAESTVLRVEGAGEYREGGVESTLGNGRSIGWRELGLLSQFLQYVFAGMHNPLAILA